ncbi:MAG: DNRLRE domain-containing protein [Dehalococcoidia bacterium]
MFSSLRQAAAAVVVVGVCLALTSTSAAFALRRAEIAWLSADTSSRLRADYSPDPRGIRLARLDPGILRAAADDDRALDEPDDDSRRIEIARAPETDEEGNPPASGEDGAGGETPEPGETPDPGDETPNAARTPTARPSGDTPVPGETVAPVPIETPGDLVTPAPVETVEPTKAPEATPTRSKATRTPPTGGGNTNPKPTKTPSATPTPYPHVFIDPEYKKLEEPGGFEVEVAVQDAPSTASYYFHVGWDPAIVTFVGISNDTFLGSTDRSVVCELPVLDVANNHVEFSCTSIGTDAAASGSGTLAILEFDTVADGITTLDLHDAVLFTAEGTSQDVPEEDGSIEVCLPTPTPTVTPTATYTDTPVPDTPTPTATNTFTATATPEPGSVYISPGGQTVDSGPVQVDVQIADALLVASYRFSVEWDPAVLSFQSISNSSFLGSTGRSVSCDPPVFETAYHVEFYCTSTGFLELPASGSGTLATIVFDVVDQGETTLDLHDTALYNLINDLLGVTELDGTVEVILPTPTPTATATYTPTPVPTDTPAPTATFTPVPTSTDTPAPTATDTPLPTSTHTPTATNTPVPTVVTLGATGDTYVDEGSPSTTHGSDAELDVDGNSSQTRRSYSAFDVGGTVPGGATIQSATLTLCITNVSGAAGRTHGLHRVTGSWTESTLSWNTQPAFSSTATDSFTVPGMPQCVDFDVTADVQAWVSGTTDYGWILKDSLENTSGSASLYASREYGSSGSRPSLSVSYVP